LIRQVRWSIDRSQVRLDGMEFWVEMWVDAYEVHVSGDLPLLGVYSHEKGGISNGLLTLRVEPTKS
jgi:hypothetical protein